MAQRHTKPLGDHQQVIEARRGDPGLDPHHGDPVEIGPLGQSLLGQAGVFAGLADLHSDRPAAREHPLGDRVGRHLINALGDDHESL